MAAQSIDVAAFTLGGTARATLAHCDAGNGFALRREILEREGRAGRTHALRKQLPRDQYSIKPADPNADFIPDPHVLRRLGGLATHSHVSRPARRRGSRTRLEDAHGPQPRVEAYGRFTHAPILP